MAGYNWFKMSNNAVAAYNEGEKPLSRWTKHEVINYIAADMGVSPADIELIKPWKEYLFRSSWHHTYK